EMLRRREITTLVTWAHDPAHSNPAVGFDNRAAMAQMTRTVLNHGHRSVAVIMAHTKHNDRTTERLIGIRQEVSRWDLNPDTLPVVETTYHIDAAREAFRQIMAGPSRPTAIICGNDVLAVGALLEARAIGLTVPGDLSITGFDDMDIATIVDPGLTTMHVPHRDMGRQSAISLLTSLEHGTPIAPIRLEARLVERGSLGPVPSRGS
ncbi:MAG: substrate-binding domain-containing protein, partial [Pseudomonadota bacterium]